MATQTPISTISYNSKSFLLEKLETWLKAHIIQAYQVIYHRGEEGDKDHFHVRLELNKRVDQMNLTDGLKEYVSNNSKPLGCRPWRPSKEDDWILYAVHDPDYLRLKYGGVENHEKIEYPWTDIIASEGYDVETAYIRARSSLKRTPPNLVKQLQSGKTAVSLIQEGGNPFVVQNILRMLSGSDYERLTEEFHRLQDYVYQLEAAIRKQGFTVCEEKNGHIVLIQEETGVDDVVDVYEPEPEELCEVMQIPLDDVPF